VTFKLPGGAGYASITEAALLNYAGMALQADGRRGLTVGLGHRHPMNHPFQLRYGDEEHARLSKPAEVVGTVTTPWRVVLVGADLNALVNSDVIHNLCPPPDPALFPDGVKTDWVRPGRAVWKYLDGGQNTLDEMKDFSRWAGELGFEYNVIEGFWRRWSEEELRGLVDFAKQRKVGIWLWRNTKELRTPEARREFFDLCQRVGAAGVKLDFFDHEAKEVVDLYETLLREAAEHKLMVNFHGANKPTGLERTWPNELTREAVRGMESSRLRERARHDTILPFTRFLAGHADYTPVHFGARRGDTTAAHQIATAAVFESSLLTYGAYPTKLLEHPAVEMIKSIPAEWDQTIVLPPSEIGELAAFARRKGDTWFLAVLNGPKSRKVGLPLSFLPNGPHRALVVRDHAADPATVEVVNEAATRETTLDLSLPAGGGFIARFSPG
jgi:alpha-glucosidase